MGLITEPKSPIYAHEYDDRFLGDPSRSDEGRGCFAKTRSSVAASPDYCYESGKIRRAAVENYEETIIET